MAGLNNTTIYLQPRLPADVFREDNPEAKTLIITCLDDCLGVGALETQLDLTKVLVVRSAANVVPTYGSGTGIEQIIEAGVSRGVREVVVLGHSNCDLLAQVFDPTTAMRNLQLATWLEHAEPARRAALELPSEAARAQVGEFNVIQQLAHLRSYPTVAAGLLCGRLRLFGWLFDAGCGSVFAADPQTHRFTRRAALDPEQNHLFQKSQRRARHSRAFPQRDLSNRYLA